MAKKSLNNEAPKAASPGINNKVVVAVIAASLVIVAALIMTLPEDTETSNVNVNALAEQLGEPEVKGDIVSGTDETLVNPTEGVDPEVLAELQVLDSAGQEELDIPDVEVPDDAGDAQSRDEQRLKDIEVIRGKLDDYNNANGSYPENLDALSGLPTDPSFDDLRGYTYTPIGKLPPKYYDLSFVVESESIEFNGVTLDRGYHVTTPDASPLY